MSLTTAGLAPGLDLSAPQDVLPRWIAAMQRGDFEAAWQQTDRIEIPRRQAAALGRFETCDHHLVWNGEPFDDRTVLVRCEHGLGDTIQFVRYLPRLRARASRVILKVQPMLLELCSGLRGADEIRNAWTTEPDPLCDVQIECMEFPYAFRDTPQTIPSRTPYLPIARMSSRDERPARDGAQRIGLIWAASDWDESRSLTLAELSPWARISGVTFYSLQQGRRRDEAGDAPFPLESLSHRTEEIAAAAAAMLKMDLIITVDSMTAHLAGALGRPVWVLLKYDSDWRWMRQGSRTPWYPTMRLFRQRAPGDWRTPIAEVAAALAARSVGSPH